MSSAATEKAAAWQIQAALEHSMLMSVQGDLPVQGREL